MQFKYCGIDVEVTDKAQTARLEEVLKNGKSYSAAAIDRAAPGMMSALRREMTTCTDVGGKPSKFTVAAGKVKAEMNPDHRRVNWGSQIGNR